MVSLKATTINAGASLLGHNGLLFRTILFLALLFLLFADVLRTLVAHEDAPSACRGTAGHQRRVDRSAGDVVGRS
jgi:hypothetical protein